MTRLWPLAAARRRAQDRSSTAAESAWRTPARSRRTLAAFCSASSNSSSSTPTVEPSSTPKTWRNRSRRSASLRTATSIGPLDAMCTLFSRIGTSTEEPCSAPDAAARGSQRDLRSHRDRPVTWESERIDGACSVAGHRDEQPLAPGAQTRRLGWLDRDARDEVRRVLEVEIAREKTLFAAQPQRLRQVELVLIALPDRDVSD